MKSYKITVRFLIFSGLSFAAALMLFTGAVNFSDAIISPGYVIQQDDPVYKEADKMPRYPVGDDELLRFISSNFVYPKDAKDQDIQGKVVISFIVEKDGSITNVKVLKGIGGGCDEEAVRITKLMKKWIPGEIKGKPVRVSMSLPFQFKLQ